MDNYETHPRRPNEPPMPDPLGFFLTWTTYGTWLPGDERGWTERGKGVRPPDSARRNEAARSMSETPCVLDDEQRALVEHTITDHGRIRSWHLHVVNCRTNHVHVVVSGNSDPREMRDQFKAWCTRRLKELARSRQKRTDAGTPPPVRKDWWTQGGSQRRLWNQASLDAAIQYVRDGQ
jgi:hypothetical protein